MRSLQTAKLTVNSISSHAIDDPILKQFRAALDEIYGARLERVVLFGSRARGDAREDSDYDIAVFIRDLGPLSSELTGLRTSRPIPSMRPELWSTRCRLRPGRTRSASASCTNCGATVSTCDAGDGRLSR